MAPITACKNKYRDQMMPSQTRFVVGVVVVAAALFAPPVVRHVNNSSLFQGQSSNLQTFLRVPSIPMSHRTNRSGYLSPAGFPGVIDVFQGVPHYG